MKKFFTSIFLGAFLLSGCFVDDVAVHNNLVTKMDGVLDAEAKFYDAYWNLDDGADTAPFMTAYTNFETAIVDLDKFFTETKFATDQEVFVTEYNEYYKPFIDGYLADAKEFADLVKAEGFVYANLEEYFANLDQKTVDFIDNHNRLIATINDQSDNK